MVYHLLLLHNCDGYIFSSFKRIKRICTFCIMVFLFFIPYFFIISVEKMWLHLFHIKSINIWLHYCTYMQGAYMVTQNAILPFWAGKVWVLCLICNYGHSIFLSFLQNQVFLGHHPKNRWKICPYSFTVTVTVWEIQILGNAIYFVCMCAHEWWSDCNVRCKGKFRSTLAIFEVSVSKCVAWKIFKMTSNNKTDTMFSTYPSNLFHFLNLKKWTVFLLGPSLKEINHFLYLCCFAHPWSMLWTGEVHKTHTIQLSVNHTAKIYT